MLLLNLFVCELLKFVILKSNLYVPEILHIPKNTLSDMRCILVGLDLVFGASQRL